MIGDLHGCYEEALDLLDRVAACTSDRVIFAGDLIDRGPMPVECVELAMAHESVMGNHEEKHLAQRARPDADIHPEHARSRRGLRATHWAWLERLPAYILLPEHGAAVVHAGALPGRPVAAQERYHLLHAQCISPPSRKSFWPSKAPDSHTFWTRHWKGPERVIFGHTVLEKPLMTEHAVGIDTGCVFGHALTAVILPDWKLVSVPSRQPKGKERAIARYEVEPGTRAYS